MNNCRIFLMFWISNLAISVSGVCSHKLTETYISNYKDIAISEMLRTGIPASIKLAQGLLESDWGRSPLASEANNHFGIKCGYNWQGKTYYKEDDDKDKDGNLIESCFRAYDDVQASYIAHSEFLTDASKKHRYGFLFSYDTNDYKAWANGLRSAGYATDPNYPNKLIQIIEKYNLSKFDISLKEDNTDIDDIHEEDQNALVNSSIPTKRTVKTKKKNNSVLDGQATDVSYSRYSKKRINGLRMLEAHGGETIKSVAAFLNIPSHELIEYNEGLIYEDQVLEKGEIVYVEKKNKKYNAKEETYISEGESMYSISQKHGIRLENLLALNRLEEDVWIEKGQEISLIKKVNKKTVIKFKRLKQTTEAKFISFNQK